MDASVLYIFFGVITMVMALYVFLFKNNARRKMSLLSGVAVILVFSGVLLSDLPLIGYSLMGAGLLIAIIDILLETGSHKGYPN